VFKLENLKTLIVSGNKIQSIPSEIANLKNLQVFQAIGCSINEAQIDDVRANYQKSIYHLF
jgi:Leucine-rich repeat (LRR) protein